MLSLYSVSTQYLQIPITNEEGINPTGDVVQFAFLGPYSNVSQATEAVPTSTTTYYTGAWQSMQPVNTSTAPNTYVAIVLIGPSGGVVTLSAGTYLVIVRVVDNPESPVLFSGPMVIS